MSCCSFDFNAGHRLNSCLIFCDIGRRANQPKRGRGTDKPTKNISTSSARETVNSAGEGVWNRGLWPAAVDEDYHRVDRDAGSQKDAKQHRQAHGLSRHPFRQKARVPEQQPAHTWLILHSVRSGFSTARENSVCRHIKSRGHAGRRYRNGIKVQCPLIAVAGYGSRMSLVGHFSGMARCPSWVRRAPQGGHRPTIGIYGSRR